MRINLPHSPTPVALYGTLRFSARYAPPPRRNRRRPPAQSWRHPALLAIHARLFPFSGNRQWLEEQQTGEVLFVRTNIELRVEIGFFQHVAQTIPGNQWSITLSVPVITFTPLSCNCLSGICSVPIGTVEAIEICCTAIRCASSSTCCSLSVLPAQRRD